MDKKLKGKSVLVVDDEEMLRTSIADYLGMYGAEVATAENGRVAFKLINQNRFDVVISDIRMPNGDGIELLRAIDEMRGEKPKCFVCSGFSDFRGVDAQELGVLHIFLKPFSNKDLLNAVLKAVS
ncbi:MAG: response regulator [Bdellovibrionales bacterium]